MEKLTLSVGEVSTALGLSERTVLNLLDDGLLPELPRWTKRRLVPKAAVDQILAKTMDGFDPEVVLSHLKAAS